MNLSGLNLPKFQMQQAASAKPAAQQAPRTAAPEFASAAPLRGNLMNPTVGGPASKVGNKLNCVG